MKLIAEFHFDIAKRLRHRSVRELACEFDAPRQPLLQFLPRCPCLHLDTTTGTPNGSIGMCCVCVFSVCLPGTRPRSLSARSIDFNGDDSSGINAHRCIVAP